MITEKDLHDYNKWLMTVWNPNQLYIPFAIDAPKAFIEHQNNQKSVSNANTSSENDINNKTKQLLSLSDEFIFPEYYTHTGKLMWKIENIYTEYNSDKLVLCAVEDGISTALDLAIKHISIAKEKFNA